MKGFLSHYMNKDNVIEVGLGYPLDSVRVNGRRVTDEPGVVKFISAPTGRQEAGRAWARSDDLYDGSLVALQTIRLEYRSVRTQKPLELPLGYCLSVYVSRGIIANIKKRLI
jgi:hypothetical protein